MSAKTLSPYWVAEFQRRRIAEENTYRAEVEEELAMRNLVPLEPCRIPPECCTPIKPGSHFAIAAERDGSEDEYSNRMKAKYGGEW